MKKIETENYIQIKKAQGFGSPSYPPGGNRGEFVENVYGPSQEDKSSVLRDFQIERGRELFFVDIPYNSYITEGIPEIELGIITKMKDNRGKEYLEDVQLTPEEEEEAKAMISQHLIS